MNPFPHHDIRILFLRATHDDHGQMVHYPGEIIIGNVLAQRADFLLIHARTGTQMYIDMTRADLHYVELQRSVGA